LYSPFSAVVFQHRVTLITFIVAVLLDIFIRWFLFPLHHRAKQCFLFTRASVKLFIPSTLVCTFVHLVQHVHSPSVTIFFFSFSYTSLIFSLSAVESYPELLSWNCVVLILTNQWLFLLSAKGNFTDACGLQVCYQCSQNQNSGFKNAVFK
jgi:hypothetical protein